MELEATASADRWNLKFFWTLGGEFQSPWLKLFRQKGDAELKKKLVEELRSHSEAFDFHDVTYVFTNNGLEVRAQASHLRNKLQGKLEILQNEFWDSGFDLRPHLLEQRSNRLLLPTVGEISSRIKILHSGSATMIPNSVAFDCPPAKYSVNFLKGNQEVTIEEKLSIRDLGVKPSSFTQFSDFLNHYYKNHFWGILLESAS